MAGPLQSVLEWPLPFPSFVQSYSTPLPGLAGGQLVCGWHRTWESHPSEDLSELHRLLVSVAMQKYHCSLLLCRRHAPLSVLLIRDTAVLVGVTGRPIAGAVRYFTAKLGILPWLIMRSIMMLYATATSSPA